MPALFLAARRPLALVLFWAAVLEAHSAPAKPRPEYYDTIQYLTWDCNWDEDTYADSWGCASVVAAPNYGGDCGTRTKLTGDWYGYRTAQAASGITYDFDVTQFYFGVVDGGLRENAAYGGHGDYVINIDCGKLGLQDGLFVKLRAEHRFGETVNFDTGALLDVELLPALPVFNSEEVYLTNVLFTQMLSESFAVFAGKLDTLDGDVNAFAHGRGKTQFSNLALVVNPAMIRTIPYSTLGAGFTIMHEGAPLFTYTILNPTDTTRTSGFEELFAEGVAMAAEIRVPVTIFGLPGHQLFGGTWSSREFTTLGQDPRVIYPDVPIATADGSWALYYNFDQYFYVDASNPAVGWGAFGRAAITDLKTNPVEWFLSAGLGGTGLFAGREQDRFGAGWYFSGTSSEIGPFIETVFGPIGNGQGVECFYNMAVTPWFYLTPDLQIVLPAREEVDTALVVGLRAQMDF